MRVVDLIDKKKHGKVLGREEIDFFIHGYVNGDIPDYQAAALLMAVWFRGMTSEETRDLTLSMASSGATADLSAIDGIKVDKHSTGGVADTTTLVVAPIVAACGGKVAKMSGRGLGHTGGTLDKLESIPGLSVDQDMETFVEIVSGCGLSIIGQTGDLVPADKKLYALRDVTGTVDSVSLIAASIMSKKIASGADAIVLDVKAGSGAFMKEIEDAVRLAETMVEIGNLAGRRTLALVTDMGQPLGNAVGNALEVREAIEILRGRHPGDLRTVSEALAARMLVLSGVHRTVAEATDAVREALRSGKALARFACMIEAQGGDPSVTEDTDALPAAAVHREIPSPRSGYVTDMRADQIGVSATLLGAGRGRKEETIDPAVGLWMRKRIGDRVEEGEPLAVFHVNDRSNEEAAVSTFLEAIEIGGPPASPRELIHRIIE